MRKIINNNCGLYCMTALQDVSALLISSRVCQNAAGDNGTDKVPAERSMSQCPPAPRSQLAVLIHLSSATPPAPLHFYTSSSIKSYFKVNTGKSASVKKFHLATWLRVWRLCIFRSTLHCPALERSSTAPQSVEPTTELWSSFGRRWMCPL